MTKQMSFDGLAAAKDRAVQMFSNFGRHDEAAEFEAMSLEEYADRKGIEITEHNPHRGEGARRGMRRRNPTERVDELQVENQELRSKLDRIIGITEVSDGIDSEGGLRKALDKVWTAAGGVLEESAEDAEEDDAAEEEDDDEEDDEE